MKVYMESIKFREYKNPKIFIVGILTVAFGILITFINILGILIFLIGMLFLFVKTEIEIFKNFQNKYNITVFSKTIISVDKKIIKPDYISLFGQSFKGANEYGLIASLGSDYKVDFYVIRFFDDNNRNDIVYKSKNKKEVLEKGQQLATLLNVELVNKL